MAASPSTLRSAARALSAGRTRAAVMGIAVLASTWAGCAPADSDAAAPATLILTDGSETAWRVRAQRVGESGTSTWTVPAGQSLTASLAPGDYTLTQTLLATQEARTVTVHLPPGATYRWPLVTLLRPEERWPEAGQ